MIGKLQWDVPSVYLVCWVYENENVRMAATFLDQKDAEEYAKLTMKYAKLTMNSVIVQLPIVADFREVTN